MHLAYYSWLFTYHRYIIYNYSGVVPKVKPEPENDAKNEGMMLCVEQHAVSAFLWEKNFAEPGYLCIAETNRRIYFCQCSKGCHIA